MLSFPALEQTHNSGLLASRPPLCKQIVSKRECCVFPPKSQLMASMWYQYNFRAEQRVSSRFNVGRNWLPVIWGHSWFFKRLLSNKFLLHRMDLKAQRILNQQTHCHLFISDWKNVVLPVVTLSFKRLKRRKVSFLHMWLVVSINTALMSLAS